VTIDSAAMPGILAVGQSNAALATFILYTLGVFVIAALSNRLLQKKAFLSEYFLGSRGLGMWAFALTFAATSASGGSFTGFPAKIYTHGWVLALWIASYMVVPVCTMGLLGKRINQVARMSGAITVPDILRDRFESRFLGLMSTMLMVFFLVFNLVAQFKAGSLILETLLTGVEPFQTQAARVGDWVSNAAKTDGWTFLLDATGNPVDGGYLLCLMTFGIAVIFYTTYGGFHAVVWTDVMQGVVMVFGVAVMLPLALMQVGGLENATQELAQMVPPRPATICVDWGAQKTEDGVLPSGSWVQQPPATADGQPRLFRTTKSALYVAGTSQVCGVEALEILSDNEITRLTGPESPLTFLDAGVAEINEGDTYAYGSEEEHKGSYVTAPGPSRTDSTGFLPLGVAISFFFMWAISGSGQPQYMVRLMAFKDSQTLRRAIITVTMYFSIIYFPLVIIFVCARVLLPGMENEPDRIMPQMAVLLTENAGVGWLAGLLVAAPFAAVMSTVDSFLLVISSSVVRDIYQRNISPDASQRTIKWMSYFCTLAVGLIALFGAISPPKFLQDIIVYVGSGLAACFLFPVVAALYWPRANKWTCIVGMLGGFGAHLAMHLIGMQLNGSFVNAYRLFGLDPVVVGLVASLLSVLIITPLTPKPPEHLVRKYFYRQPAQG